MNSTGKKKSIDRQVLFNSDILLPLTPNSLFDSSSVAVSKMLCNILPRMSIFPIHLQRAQFHPRPFLHSCQYKPRELWHQQNINFMNRISLNFYIDLSQNYENHATLLENPIADLSQFSLLTPWYCCIILSNSPEYWLWKECKRALSSSEAEHLTDLWRLSSKSTHCWCGYKLSHFKD